MQSIAYSTGLTHAVRSLKQLEAEQLTSLFKDSNWFEAFSLSTQEGKAAMKLFARTTKAYLSGEHTDEGWT